MNEFDKIQNVYCLIVKIVLLIVWMPLCSVYIIPYTLYWLYMAYDKDEFREKVIDLVLCRFEGGPAPDGPGR